MTAPDNLPPVPLGASCPECGHWLGVERIESGELNCAHCKHRWIEAIPAPVQALDAQPRTGEITSWDSKPPVERLRAVLCNPEGKCCIEGSDADRIIIDNALADIERRAAAAEAELSRIKESIILICAGKDETDARGPHLSVTEMHVRMLREWFESAKGDKERLDWLPIESAPTKGVIFLEHGPEHDPCSSAGFFRDGKWLAAAIFHSPTLNGSPYQFRQIEVKPRRWTHLPELPPAPNERGEQAL